MARHVDAYEFESDKHERRALWRQGGARVSGQSVVADEAGARLAPTPSKRTARAPTKRPHFFSVPPRAREEPGARPCLEGGARTKTCKRGLPERRLATKVRPGKAEKMAARRSRRKSKQRRRRAEKPSPNRDVPLQTRVVSVPPAAPLYADALPRGALLGLLLGAPTCTAAR